MFSNALKLELYFSDLKLIYYNVTFLLYFVILYCFKGENCKKAYIQNCGSRLRIMHTPSHQSFSGEHIFLVYLLCRAVH